VEFAQIDKKRTRPSADKERKEANEWEGVKEERVGLRRVIGTRLFLVWAADDKRCRDKTETERERGNYELVE
jgi:hypothetical protein